MCIGSPATLILFGVILRSERARSDHRTGQVRNLQVIVQFNAESAGRTRKGGAACHKRWMSVIEPKRVGATRSTSVNTFLRRTEATRCGWRWPRQITVARVPVFRREIVTRAADSIRLVPALSAAVGMQRHENECAGAPSFANHGADTL